MTDRLAQDVAYIQNNDAIPKILDVLCRTTGMGFAAVARVTEDRWIACQVQDGINFGMKPGDELKVETTICNEVRQAHKAVFIDHVEADDDFCGHPTPVLYGFQSYVSVPIILKDGAFFGTLCAIDPHPASVKSPAVMNMFEMFADLIAFHIHARDRVDASVAMEKLAERLELALAAGDGVGTWDWNVQTDQVVADERFARLFGLDPRQAASGVSIKIVLDTLHPDDVERVRRALQTAISSGDSFNCDFRLAPDGGVRWATAQGRCALDQDGHPLRFPGISFDISDRKKAERRSQALVDLDDRFRRLIRPADLAFVAAEILGQTLEVSRAGYGTVDLAAETITIERDWNAPGIKTLAGTLKFRDYGSYVDDLKRGDTVVFADAALDPRTEQNAQALEAISARAAVNMPVTESEGFAALLYLNHATPRTWSKDDLAFVRAVAHRTRMAVQRRRAEAELRDLAVNLEAQVAARTAALMEAEEALRQSQKMEAVGQLTGGIAHDFNNLLTGISGSLEMLQTRVSQGRLDAIPRYVDAAQTATKRAASLTQRLLAFSRRQTLDPRPVNANRLVADMEEIIRRTIGPNTTMEFVGAVGLWPTLADHNQLENALLNLCINARDAMPDGGRITIETANKWIDDKAAKDRDLVPGQYISICVTDTGTGMTPEVVSRAFDPFYTTKPLGQGTGLGLSMIYGFVRQSNGQVRIYSEVGHGTTMCLYLPRYFGELSADAGHQSDLASYEGGLGETVLVVDDEPIVRMLIADVLRDAGYRAIEAQDGPEGLKILQTTARIDLLITDVGLPGGMNGRQVADAGRTLRPDLPVLFITGYAENAVVGNGHLDPGMQVVTKPFAIDALGNKIRELIDGAKG